MPLFDNNYNQPVWHLFEHNKLNKDFLNRMTIKQRTHRHEWSNHLYKCHHRFQFFRHVRTITIQSNHHLLVVLEEGMYKIVQVRNAGEFYGLSQIREKEYTALSQRLEDYYNNLSNESLLRDNLVIEGMPYVIQDREKYQRVIVK